ncbi:MAG TPA: Crp/Fnr family transcriptional regulator [Vicinamibacterales bacterium]|jgi:CRP/FNR family transcriptional regulator|nr:Crp/Fnr family transcriptional regulator [Vicinamibacterales bacterium]|tara:strand:+ start:418 stop:1191 length:774 start_codon:yes stop_codon:yes gene_type:complete
MLFLREECEHCCRWEASAIPASAGPPRKLTRLLPDYTRSSPVVAKTRRYERGERIFEEGATSELFFTTTSGSVKLVKTSLQGNDSIVGIAAGICPLNPDGLDNGRSFLATAVALEDTTCIVVPKRELVALFEEQPTVALRLYRELCESLDASFTRITELSRGTVEVRLAQLFLRLARTAGRVQGSTTFVPIRLSRQELADAVGTTIETCIRLMSRWDKRRFIYASDGGFVVSDAERLELLAQAVTPHPHREDPAPGH